MALVDTTLITSNGYIVLVDGTKIFIEEVQYSPDGVSYWESTFNPQSHIYEGDGVTQVAGHKYRRLKHAGDTAYQTPHLFVATDGNTPLFQTSTTHIQVSTDEGTSYDNLVALADITGEQGDAGPVGTGLEIDASGTLTLRPLGYNISGSTTEPVTYLSLGNHALTTDDIGNETTYWHTLDGTTWTQSTNSELGDFVLGWQATDGTGTAALTTNLAGQTMLYSATGLTWAQAESKGKVYAWSTVNNNWTELTGISAETGQVRSTSGDILGYLEDKTDGVTIDVTSNDLHVVDNSIGYAKLDPNAFGDGVLDTGSAFAVDVTLLIGATNNNMTEDGSNNLYVNTATISGHGLSPDTNFSGQKVMVDSSELIQASGSGLATVTTGGYDYLYVLDGEGIVVSSSGVEVDYDSSYGLELQTGKLAVNINTTKMEFTGSGEVSLKDSYITGTLIPAASISHTTLSDLTTGDPHTQYLLESTYVAKGDIISASAAATPSVLTVGTDGYHLVADSTQTTGLNWKQLSAGSTATSIGAANDAGSSTTHYAREDHVHAVADGVLTIAKTSGLQAALDDKVKKDFAYGKMRIVTSGGNEGLQLSPDGSNWFLIGVDAGGNLTVSSV